MRANLQQEAWEALEHHDYALAAKNWVKGYGLPEDIRELEKIFSYVNTLNESEPNPDLCAILGLIALDYNEVFDSNRQTALIQCVQWSRQGLEMNPEHYDCCRNAGSALYWLGDNASAAKYYERAIALSPSPVLQIRLFNIKHSDEEQPDFSALKVSTDTDKGMEAYNAGVELNRLLEQYPGMDEAEQQRLTLLKRQCYERAYTIYHGAVVEENGDLLNYDPRTFAMCCTNLAREATAMGEYARAIAITTEGMEHCVFMFILLNRFHVYISADMHEQVIEDGHKLLEMFSDEMDLVTYLDTINGICNSCTALKQFEEALDWSEAGLKTYYELAPTDPITQDADVVRCFTNFFINKSKASEALGLKPDTATASQETDQLLETMPDNPSLLISRANTFIEEGNLDKALDCYQYAIHFASQQGMERSVQVAFYNMGYLQAVHLNDKATALESLEQSMAAGNKDFWCYYWTIHCTYQLSENEKTVHYGALALKALATQEGVTDDVIAQIHEHIGTSQIDLEDYDKAFHHLQESLKLHETSVARQNLKIAQDNMSPAGGLFRKLFGRNKSTE